MQGFDIRNRTGLLIDIVIDIVIDIDIDIVIVVGVEFNLLNRMAETIRRAVSLRQKNFLFAEHLCELQQQLVLFAEQICELWQIVILFAEQLCKLRQVIVGGLITQT